MSIRTDLAMESAAVYENNLPEGVSCERESHGKLTLSRVKISSEKGEQVIGKPQGTYTTIEGAPFWHASQYENTEIEFIADQIARLLPKQGTVLVVGLGNSDITPDALGPRTAHQILATRHITGEVAKQSGLDGLRPVAAIAPGVLGQTGIETSEIVRSVVSDIHPGVVIVIDALAAHSTSRLGSTIQLSDTGISPGSGVMNKRKELSLQTLGVPVLSIGIPTVVDAATLAEDLVRAEVENVRELFETDGHAMMVTPRDVDLLIEKASDVLALAINKALQPEMSLEDLVYLAS